MRAMGLEFGVAVDEASAGEFVVDLASPKMPASLKGRLAPPSKDPVTGWLTVEGFGARVGVQMYAHLPSGEQRQHRPPEEVFSADSLASWAGKPFLVRHPQQRGDALPLVTAQTAAAHVSGSVISASAERDLGLVRVRFLVTHPEGIAAIEDPDGPRELSAGYIRALDKTPGVTGAGEVYDAVQREIRINHLSLVDEARAGQMARVRAANDGREGAMELETIVVDGVAIQVPKAQAEALRAVQAKLAQVQAKLTAAEVDAAKAAAKQMRGDLAPLLGGVALEGLSVDALRLKAVQAAYPELGEEKNQAVVDALYDKAVVRLKASAEALRQELGGGAAPQADASAGEVSQREAWMASTEQMWRRPADQPIVRAQA